MSKIGDFFAYQCGNPKGIIGNVITWMMNQINKNTYKKIVEELEINENTKILDIGFGNGYLEKLIIKKSICHINGIDISKDMVDKAKKKNNKYVKSGNITFELGDCCNIQFKDNSFDAVTTMNTIYFLSDVNKGMKEVYRVLKKDGSFYNAVISKEKLDKIFYTKNGFKKFTKEEYIELGKQTGFRKIQIKELGKTGVLLIIYTK